MGIDEIFANKHTSPASSRTFGAAAFGRCVDSQQVWFEENIARDLAAVQASNTELRTLFTQLQGIVTEEKKARVADVTELSRRLKKQEDSMEEAHQRLWEVMRAIEIRSDEHQKSLQEGKVFREEFEVRIMAGLREETKQREAGLQRERDALEARYTEQWSHWREQLKEERQIRSIEDEKLTSGLLHCEDAVRAEQKLVTLLRSEVADRIETFARSLADESGARRSEISQICVQTDELRGELSAEVQSRRVSEAVATDRSITLEASLKDLNDRTEQNLILLQDALQELRSAWVRRDDDRVAIDRGRLAADLALGDLRTVQVRDEIQKDERRLAREEALRIMEDRDRVRALRAIDDAKGEARFLRDEARLERLAASEVLARAEAPTRLVDAAIVRDEGRLVDAALQREDSRVADAVLARDLADDARLARDRVRLVRDVRDRERLAVDAAKLARDDRRLISDIASEARLLR